MGTINRKRIWVSLGVVALLAGGGFAVYASKSPSPAKAGDTGKQDTPLAFTAEEVVQPRVGSMPVQIEFSGPLVAPGTVIVRSKASGVLNTLAVAEGSRVKAGQSLGELDLEELRARVAEREANVAAGHAQFLQAEKVFKANEDLASKNFIASTALDTSRAAMEAARGQWLAAKAQLDTAQVMLKQARLVSPISGLVSKRYALAGEKLAAEQQVLSIVDLSRLELAGLVGTHEVGRIKPGMKVSVRVEGDEQAVEALVSRIAPAAEPGTRSIVVTLALDNPAERFRAGQYAQARLELADTVDRLTLPESAVLSNAGQHQVWVIDKGTLLRRTVSLGRHEKGTGRVEIVQGLKSGEQVLGARFDNLREGARAEIQGDKPKVASAVASGAVSQ